MTDSTGDDRLDRIEQGLDAVFATEVAAEILEAVDFEEIMADEPAQDPVDVERLAEALGRPVGHLLAHRVIGGSGATGLAKRAIGSRVGSHVVSETVRVAAETVDPDAVVDGLVELDEETPGPALNETVVPVVADSDLLTLELLGVSQHVDDVDAGGDARGVHDAAGADHTGVLDETDQFAPDTESEPAGVEVPVESDEPTTSDSTDAASDPGDGDVADESGATDDGDVAGGSPDAADR